MSMLDSFFNKGFKAAKCKTLLKLTVPRIKLLRNRREIQIKQMRRDIAKLLETGQEATARIRVEHIIREENMMAAQEILELFCELISVRLPIIEAQRECPLDLKEAISSICFAAPRCADLPELLQVQMLFVSKYGKEFVSAAAELMPECGVNRQLIELLSIRAPSPEKKLKLLKEIAEEHELDWDPAASEIEFLKPHEDLLNGPTQFVSGTKLPLPKEKHDEALNNAPDHAQIEDPDADMGFDPLDFPEVPNTSLRPSANAISAPDITTGIPAAVHPDTEHELLKHSTTFENLSQEEPHSEHENVVEEKSMASKDEIPKTIVEAKEERQFLPFISPPSLRSTSFSPRTSILPPSISRTKSDANADVQDDLAAAQSAAFISPPSLSSTSFSQRPSISPSFIAETKSNANVDLQDVLAAAQTAAETAERAAAAARSAATLAQTRISELTKKTSDKFPDSCEENPFHTDTTEQSGTAKKPHFDQQHSLGNHHGFSNYLHPHQLQEDQASEVPELRSFDKIKLENDFNPNDHPILEQGSACQQPKRLPSMDDDSYFSYPNLFTSQNPNLGSSAQSATDNSHSSLEHY